MGLVVRRCAGLPDAGIENDPRSRKIVIDAIRELRPRVVVTHWTSGRHPDHRRAAELVYDACFLSGLVRYDARGGPFRPVKLIHATGFRQDAPRPSFVVDVSDQLQRKLEALAAYESQFASATQAGEVFPGGDRPLFDQIRAEMAHYGALVRVPFGEPFRTRETARAETLGSLNVGTF